MITHFWKRVRNFNKISKNEEFTKISKESLVVKRVSARSKHKHPLVTSGVPNFISSDVSRSEPKLLTHDDADEEKKSSVVDDQEVCDDGHVAREEPVEKDRGIREGNDSGFSGTVREHDGHCGVENDELGDDLEEAVEDEGTVVSASDCVASPDTVVIEAADRGVCLGAVLRAEGLLDHGSHVDVVHLDGDLALVRDGVVDFLALLFSCWDDTRIAKNSHQVADQHDESDDVPERNQKVSMFVVAREDGEDVVNEDA